jgi:Low affinity iron permease
MAGMGGSGGLGRRLEAMARTITRFTGSARGFGLALGTIVVWGMTGPVFHFSDTWQLVINTETTVVTFLMVFLIQRSQNKDSLALQLKLKRDRGRPRRGEQPDGQCRGPLRGRAGCAPPPLRAAGGDGKRDVDLMQSHSVDEAATRHEMKHGRRKGGRKT